MRLYFAYGSNMNVDQMEYRCPNAIPVGAGRIDDWRVMINQRGVATLKHLPGASAWGAVWEIDEDDERTLDICEGVKTGFYRKVVADVVLDNGETVDALVYVDTRNREGEPRVGYLERCLEGAKEWGIPEAVEELSRYTPPTERPRARRKVNRKVASQRERELSEWVASLY